MARLTSMTGKVAFVGDRELKWLMLPFKLIEPFVLHPERIAVVAALFLLGYLALLPSRRFRARPLLVAAIAWGLWVPWEWHCKAMGYDIRVDLLVLCPLFIGVTVWALIASFWLKSWK